MPLLAIAEKVAASKYADIFVDTATTLPATTIDKLISTFENNIAPVEHLWLTTPLDVNKDSKVILLLHDIQDGYTPGSSYVAGYFDAINQYTDAATTSQLGLRSNYAEMLYLDTYPSDPIATSSAKVLPKLCPTSPASARNRAPPSEGARLFATKEGCGKPWFPD